MTAATHDPSAATHDPSAGPALEARGLGKTFGRVHALADVSFTLEPDRIHGLLGRNGAGKTTLMRLLTGQELPTSGSALVFGEVPFENAPALARICFVKESQVYPEILKVRHILAAARLLYPSWQPDVADDLLAAFDLPVDRPARKLSRGMKSALGIVIGIASRAPITIFDEPYLGLDPAARELFYDRLLADYSEHPRTIVLSTHLIDEVANLLERVVVVHAGRIVLDAEADDLRGSAAAVTGTIARIEEFTAGRRVLHREALGSRAKVTVLGRLSGADRALAVELGLDLVPVSLQQLVMHATSPDPSRAVDARVPVGGPTALEDLR